MLFFWESAALQKAIRKTYPSGKHILAGPEPKLREEQTKLVSAREGGKEI